MIKTTSASCKSRFRNSAPAAAEERTMATQINEVAKVYARSLIELARELGGNPGVAAMG